MTRKKGWSAVNKTEYNHYFNGHRRHRGPGPECWRCYYALTRAGLDLVANVFKPDEADPVADLYQIAMYGALPEPTP